MRRLDALTIAGLLLAGCSINRSSGAGFDAPPASSGQSTAAGGVGDAAQPDPFSAISPSDTDSIVRARNHLNRDGLFDYTGITKASLGAMQRDTSFDGTVNGLVYASPLYVEYGHQGAGAFFIATENDYVFALDETTGLALPGWPIVAGTPAQQTGTMMGCAPIVPIGITGTPAVDLATHLIVFDAVNADAAGNIASHVIQAWPIDDPTKGPKWTLDVHARFPAFDAKYQAQRSAVLIVNGTAYVAYGSYNDCPPYHGWIIGVPLSNPSGARSFMTPVVGGGIWGPGGPASDGTNIFAISGNRQQDLEADAAPAWNGSNALFRLGQDLSFSGKPADFFVPAQWDVYDRYDWDLGSSGPLVVDAPAMKPSELIVTLGKSGNAVLLDRNNLGGLDGGPLAQATIFTGTPGSPNGQIINAAAWATIGSGTYVVAKGYFEATALDCDTADGGEPDGSVYDLVALKLDPEAENDVQVVWCASSGGMGSPSITMSTAGNDAIVWTEGAIGDNALHAWDLETGTALYSSPPNTLGSAERFTAPIAVHGRVFVAGDSMMYAFATGVAGGMP